MRTKLTQSSYGKGAVRVKKVTKHADWHEMKEFTVQTVIEGNFDTAHRLGDNTGVLPTDTQKNTIYALAKDHPVDSIENYGQHLSAHLMKDNDHFDAVTVSIEQTQWERIKVGSELHPYAYRKGGPELWTTEIHKTKDGISISSGVEELLVLKTTDSGFSDFKRDELTTLKDTADRMLSTSLSATWNYNTLTADFEVLRTKIQNILLVEFAKHKSLSVQHTLFAMGEAVLANVKEVVSIDIEMPNIHNLLVNLSVFKRENDNEVFIVTDEPYGIINGSLTREDT